MLTGAGIYAIECLRARRAYVGATKYGFEQRWLNHRIALKRGHHNNRPLQRDWRAVGCGWFKFVVLEVLPVDQVFASREQAWMDRIRDQGFALYNVEPAREGRLSFLVHTSTVTPVQSWGLRPPPDSVNLMAAANHLRVARGTLARWIQAGHFSAFKRGKYWRVDREYLEHCQVRRGTAVRWLQDENSQE